MQSKRISKQIAFAAITCLMWFTYTTTAIVIDKAAYKDIVIEIKDYVPVERCAEILFNIEVSYFYIFILILWLIDWGI